MGDMAAQLLLKRIHNPKEAYPDSIVFEPELIVRESTAPPRKTVASAKRRKR
jgi:DNA-binding LacI/PurR family transcriptional regulator